MREIDWCGGWTFRKKDGADTPVTLPHDATILEGRAADSPAGTGAAFFCPGFYIYEKRFAVPEEWAEQEVLVRFEGVYPKAEVYLNDVRIGVISYGYSEYVFALAGLKAGEENTIRVETDGTGMPNSRWYAGAGIYRPVCLLVGDKEHIEPDGVRVTTVSIDPAVIRVEVAHTAKDPAVRIRTEIYEDSGRTIICGCTGRKVAESFGARAEILIPDAKLWDAEHPNLYTCSTTLLRDGEVLDEAQTIFGIRTLSWSTEGFFVNGKSVLLKGGCVHHDNGILGARTYREAEERRVRKLKKGGFNAIRSAHDPMCRYALNACDEIGMYVLDEAWDMWDKPKNPQDYASRFTAHFEEDLASMTRKDYSHPCVIMYSIGNEVTEPATPEGVELARKIVEVLKANDPGRPVTAGLNLTLLLLASLPSNPMQAASSGGSQDGGSAAPKMSSTEYNKMVSEQGSRMTMAAATPQADAVAAPVLNLLDIQGYNYASSRYEMEGSLHPERIVLGTETYPYDLPSNWRMVERIPYLIGDFMWTAWDYIGETGLGAWSYDPEDAGFSKKYPWLLADSGAYDILGDDNAEAGAAAVIWGARKTPYIGVCPVNHPGMEPVQAMWRRTNARPFWSYADCEGNPATVEVYTKGGRVELYLNGQLLGSEEVSSEYKAVFHTQYHAGELKAIAYDREGNEMGESALISADEHTRITITPESTAKIGGLLYVNLDITGANGILECNRDTRLTLSVEGAQVLAFGSANPKTEELYHTLSHTTYYGRSQAVLLVEETQVRISVSGDGLKTQSLTVAAEGKS